MDIGDWSYGDLLDTAAGQRRRIAELEAALSQSMGDHVDTGRALRLERAETARLRDGIGNAMLCDSVVQMHECLAALLGGGE